MPDRRRMTWDPDSADATGAGVVDDPEDLPAEVPGHYESDDGPRGELGRGGMGRVVLVRDRVLGRKVARKELLTDPNGTQAQRFLREARVTACLQHPNIVPVYELARGADGRAYYTMKRVRGRTLRDALDATKTLADRLALLPHFVDLCNAIAYAHAMGVVHRDIKPDNLMVGEFGETLVLDWGLAKVRGQIDLGESDVLKTSHPLESADTLRTMHGVTLGTPAYMSPEQARGEVDRVDERSDVWSLGAVLYEIASGRPPFDGESTASILGKVRTGETPPIREVADAPRAIAAIIERALRADPQLRYPDAVALAADVEAFMSGARVGAYDYTIREEIGRFVGAHREVFGAVGVAMIAGIAFAGVSVHRITAERDRAQHAEQALADEQHRTEEALASSLASTARDRLRDGDAASARVLAARSLDLHESVDTRGLLVAATSVAQPRLAWSTPTDTPCDMLRVSPDGGHLACSRVDGPHLFTRDAAHTERAYPIADPQGWGFSWSPDGQRFAVGGDVLARVVDVGSGRVVQTVDTGDLAIATAFLPDGGLAVGCNDGVVRVYRDGKPTQRLEGPDGWVVGMAVGPDGTLAVASSDHTIRLWDLTRGVEKAPLDEHGHGGSTVAWLSADVLASDDWIGDDQRVWLWDTSTGHARLIDQGTAEVTSISVASDAGYVLEAQADGSIRMFDRDGALLGRLPDMPAGLIATAVSRDGRVIDLSSGGLIREWSLASPLGAEVLRGHAREVTSVRPLGDGTILSTDDDGVLIRWDPATGHALQRQRVDTDGLWGLVVAPGGLVIGSRQGDVRGLDPATLAQRWQTPVGPGANDAVLTADGRSALFVDGDGLTRLSVADGAITGRFVADPPDLASVAVAPGAVIAISGESGAVYALDPDSLRVTRTLHVDADSLSKVAVSPDGRQLAIADSHGKVYVFAWPDGELFHTVVHGDEAIGALAYSPDGRWLAGGGDDGIVSVFDARTFDLRARIPAHGTRAVRELAFVGPDQLFTGGGDDLVHHWRLSALDATGAGAVDAARRDLGLEVIDGSVAPAR